VTRAAPTRATPECKLLPPACQTAMRKKQAGQENAGAGVEVTAMKTLVLVVLPRVALFVPDYHDFTGAMIAWFVRHRKGTTGEPAHAR